MALDAELSDYPEIAKLLAHKSSDLRVLIPLMKGICQGDMLRNLALDHLKYVIEQSGESASERAKNSKIRYPLGEMDYGIWNVLNNKHLLVIIKDVPSFDLERIAHIPVVAADIGLGFFGHGSAVLNVYTKIGAKCSSIFEKEGRLGPSEKIRVVAGDVIYLEGGANAAEFCRESGDLKLLQVASTAVDSITTFFDRKTLEAAFTTASHADASHVEFLLDTICYLYADADASTKARASAAIRRIALTDSRHFVRWKAAKAAAAVDVDHFLDIARKLADDPHPHVSRAATKTIENVLAKGY